VSQPNRTHRGAAPRHLELARQAIRRAEQGVEPLDRAIARAIDAGINEAADVAEMTGDLRCRGMVRALALLRLRQSLTPMELSRALGHPTSKQAWATLRRLVAAGFARRSSRGYGRYVPAMPTAARASAGAA